MIKLNPIVWEKYGNYEIRDIQHTEHQQVADFLWKYSVSAHPVYQSVYENEAAGLRDAFEIYHKYIMKWACSLLVMDPEEGGKICGAVLQCPMLKSLKSWTNLDHVHLDEKVMVFVNIVRDLIRVYQKENGYEDSFHIFNVTVPPAMKGDSWKIKLLNASHRVAASMKISRLTFVAFVREDQIRAERIKFEERGKIFYPSYVEPKSNQLIFNAFYKANTKEQYITLYDKEVLPATRYKDMEPLVVKK